MIKFRLYFLVITAALAVTSPSTVFGQPILSTAPPPPPLNPSLHDIPSQVNFENQALYAAWRPIAIILHQAFQGYYDQHRLLEQRLNALPSRRFVNGRLRITDPSVCAIAAQWRDVRREFTLYSDNTNYLFMLSFEYIDNTSDQDRRNLGSELNNALVARNRLQIEFMTISNRIDLSQINRCS